MWFALLVAALPLQDPQAPAAAPPGATPSFAQVVATHFAAWDSDHDGILSPREIDTLCVAPAVRGDEAAAAAALKGILRSGRYTVPELNAANLLAPTAARVRGPVDARAAAGERTAPSGAPAGAVAGADAGVAPATAAAAAGKRAADKPALPPSGFQSSYVRALRKIAGSQRTLFLGPVPDIDHCHQGPLGDCYFVATVGAFVHRDGAALRCLVREEPAGGYAVRFGDVETRVAPLTDAEIALSSVTGGDGLWLAVLEKALGTARHAQDPKRYPNESATDAIANGGSTATVLRLLTGHVPRRVQLKRQPRATRGATGATETPPPVPAAPLEELAARVRGELTAAFADERLVTCSTGTEKQPPGIDGRHAYAVLGIDAATDTVQVWNPHGNTFRPRGAAGLETGYATRAGVFAMPLHEFVQVFRALDLETSRVAR